VIVDEPTAGLDPEERNRFLNLLAAIGEEVVVILSTHIVADVADLCPAMAILAQGRVVATGAPGALLEGLRGRVWRCTVDLGGLEALQRDHTVISNRLAAGRTVAHILADASPGEGFTPVEGGLEDYYFATLAAARGAV
jgi:ABC-2 type transport system ATP-binding protein